MYTAQSALFSNFSPQQSCEVGQAEEERREKEQVKEGIAHPKSTSPSQMKSEI